MADDFQFIKETRKEKPINRKRLVRHVIEAVILAVIFGAIAALTFVLLRPKMEQYFTPEEQPQVSFEEEQPPEETEPVTIPEDDPEKEPEEQEKPEPETVIIEKKETMDLSEYQVLQNQLYGIGRKADRFVVAVTGVTSDTDIFNTTYESKGTAAGVIIAQTAGHYLILTEKKNIQGASSIRITFVDDSTVEGELLRYDGNTGIAVIRVRASVVSEETKKQIAVAELGSSGSVLQGQIVLAVGSPLGTMHSILTGNITSNKNSISTMDRNYTIFTTDMIGNSNGTGALINTKGEIIGIVLQDYNLQKSQTTLTAVAISQLKGVIELLSNNKPVPYMGMRVSTVTEEISEEYSMPVGVYVREVALDSPAMIAGFQSGDVITDIGGNPVTTAEEYENMLLKLGEEEVVHIGYQRQGGEDYIPLESELTVGVMN